MNIGCIITYILSSECKEIIERIKWEKTNKLLCLVKIVFWIFWNFCNSLFILYIHSNLAEGKKKKEFLATHSHQKIEVNGINTFFYSRSFFWLLLFLYSNFIIKMLFRNLLLNSAQFLSRPFWIYIWDKSSIVLYFLLWCLRFFSVWIMCVFVLLFHFCYFQYFWKWFISKAMTQHNHSNRFCGKCEIRKKKDLHTNRVFSYS